MDKKIRVIILISMLLLTLFITSCKKEGAVVTYDYRKGTEGIEMRFLQSTQRDQIYVGDEFNAMITVENKGAPLEPTEVFIVLSGPSPYTNIPVGEYTSILLEGKSALFPQGGFGTVSFGPTYNIQVPSPEADYYKTNLMATACYDYRTLASENVCIDPNPYRSVQLMQSCTPQEQISVSGGQGGPVAVTGIEEHLSTERVNFIITIKNMGTGAVFDPYGLNDCINGDIYYTDLNKVYYRVDLGGDFYGDCYPANSVVPLGDDGSGMISCTFDLGYAQTNNAYMDQLSVELEYGYTTSIQKPIEIVNILG